MEGDVRLMRRPRLLYLGHNLPYPPHEGALIRSYHTVRILSRAFDVTALYFCRRSAATTRDDFELALAHMVQYGDAHAFRIHQDWSRLRLIGDHGLSLFSQRPYTRWTYHSGDFRRKLEEALESERFDVVHMDSLDLYGYLPLLRDLPVVLAHHNVESQLLMRRAEAERGPTKWYISRQARLVERIERDLGDRVELNITVSDEDAVTLRNLSPRSTVITLPNGVDTHHFRGSNARQTPGMLAFVGGHSWFPNADGMRYFATSILPRIKREVPGVTVKWVGKAPLEVRSEFAAMGVEMLGYVEDIRPTIDEAECVIVPLRVGGGTRLKILDAWSLGKAVVSTTRGCEGLRVRDGANILVADTPEAFSRAVVRTLKDAGLRRVLEAGGRTTTQEHYDWEVVGSRMLDAYLNLLPG